VRNANVATNSGHMDGRAFAALRRLGNRSGAHAANSTVKNFAGICRYHPHMTINTPTISPDLARLERQWAAINAAAEAVLGLAGSAFQVASPEPLPHFPKAVAALTGARKRLVEDSLGDLVAIMEPGLAALLAVHERGGNAAVPAQALWHEFASARAMLVAIALDQPL